MTNATYKQIAALRRDYLELREKFNPSRVQIVRVFAPPDLLCCIRVRVYALTYHLCKMPPTARPRQCRSLSFELRVRKGYPVLSPTVYFYGNQILASPNVTRMGLFKRNSKRAGNRLAEIVEEVIRAILYADLSLPAGEKDLRRTRKLASWQTRMNARGCFPTDAIENYLNKTPQTAANPSARHDRTRRRMLRVRLNTNIQWYQQQERGEQKK